MTQPTHTHKTRGGRFALVAHYNGDTSLESHQIVVYRDLDLEVDTATTTKDWETNWRPVAGDDCTVCMGTGTDQIKGNKDRPCGGCFGLGKVRQDGETPKDRWQLAEVAAGIIKRQQQELEQRRQAMALPGVKAALEAHRMERQRQQEDAVAEQEQKWRGSRGHGPGGARHTGD
ncbi:hypothetical protein [Halomonas lysinitropha]|uniref:Uncharacterized protein n=1 Tax=Halomonas lysinitropha TaxID=2607506 RepID=A0A5K1I4B5_9GAMM|nr:hypothetical protein [Halomonas lysinitropha]VVZ96454.1 hypothetical protein HALO32_02554 [Halomonas lysinitropha]